MNPYHKLMDSFARTQVGGWLFLCLVSTMDHFFDAVDQWHTEFVYPHRVLSQPCIGAKSSKKRSVAVLSTPLEGRFALVASAAGHEKHPGWYHTLKVHPECTLFIRNKGMIPCVAHEAEGDEQEQA